MPKVEKFVGVVGIALSIACIHPNNVARAQNAPAAPTPRPPPTLTVSPIWQMVPAAESPNSAFQSVWLYNTQTGQTYECVQTPAGPRCFAALIMQQTQNSN
jgi:hypothetical protein